MIRVTVELGRGWSSDPQNNLKGIGRIMIARVGHAGHRENHVAHLFEDRTKDAKVLGAARIMDFDNKLGPWALVREAIEALHSAGAFKSKP